MKILHITTRLIWYTLESSQHKGISQHKGVSQQTAINQQSPDDQLDKDTTRHEQSRSTRCVRANFGHARNTTAATTTSYGSTRPGCKDDRQINDNISSNTIDTISEAGLGQVHHEAAVRNKDSGDVHLSAGRTQALDGAEKIHELKIVHWNAQGANQKTARITSTILNENIDMMMIQDTRIQERPDGRAPVRVPGYYTFHKPIDENCHGLLTIVKRQIPAQHVDTLRY